MDPEYEDILQQQRQWELQQQGLSSKQAQLEANRDIQELSYGEDHE